MMILESLVLILLVLTVRKFFAGRVSYRLLYSLWGLVLLKLLLPFDFISAPLSLRSLFVPKQSVNVDRTELFMEEEAVQEKTLFYEDRTEEEGGRNRKEAAGIIQKEKTEDNGKEAAGTIRKEKTEDNGKEKKEEPEDSLQKRQPKPAAEEIPVPKKTQITYVIMGISVLFFAAVSCANLHFMMKLRKQRILYDGSGKIPVYVTGLVPVPCLYGIFPAVYLSEAAAKMPEKEVRQIILHETMHYRQGDHIWSFFRTALLCIYWFHPFIYPAFFASREDAELSCDEAVIRMIGNEEGRKKPGQRQKKKWKLCRRKRRMTVGKRFMRAF